jgi:peptidoglycan/xylan/chitin deacetylase (PgdA/CDA1 family)
MTDSYIRIRAFAARAILFLVAALILASAGRLFYYAISGETNADLIATALNPCTATPITPTGKMAIIRLDDVQAFAWAATSIRMMDDARSRGIPLVLGVIPKGIEGDRVMYEYLRDNRCFHEIAQHGWDHGEETGGEAPEFRDSTYEEARTDISRGRAVLETLSREKMTTFIPPNNEASPATLDALKTLGIPVVSSAGTGRFDFHATTFDYASDVITSADDVLADCADATAESDVCVVMVHPQEFMAGSVMDEEKYRIYTDILDRLARDGYTFARFKDLVDFDRTYSPWERFLLPALFDAR